MKLCRWASGSSADPVPSVRGELYPRWRQWLADRVNFDMALFDTSRLHCGLQAASAVLCPYRSARCFAQRAVQDSRITESVPERVLQTGYRDEVLGGAGVLVGDGRVSAQHCLRQVR